MSLFGAAASTLQGGLLHEMSQGIRCQSRNVISLANLSHSLLSAAGAEHNVLDEGLAGRPEAAQPALHPKHTSRAAASCHNKGFANGINVRVSQFLGDSINPYTNVTTETPGRIAKVPGVDASELIESVEDDS